MRAVDRKKKKAPGKNSRAAGSDKSSQKLAVGVDIGGTKVAAGLVDLATGKIQTQIRTPMAASGSAAEGLASVTAAIDQLLRSAGVNVRKIRGIGVCAPGPLDPNAGVIVNPPNVRCWRNFPLAAEISKAYGVFVKLDNDANAAGLAETIWGAGRGYRNVFYATVGTGIGTGIVLDGKILHGRTGAAGEGGHVSIDYRGPKCACGKNGCIETLAAGPAIAKAARAQAEQKPQEAKLLLELAGGKTSAITGEIVSQAYRQGDLLAKTVLDQEVEYLAHWLGNVVDLLEPEVIVVGGGVSLMLKSFLPGLNRRLNGFCENQRANEIPIVPSHYGDDAGVAGGAALCMDVSGIERKPRSRAT